MKIQKSFFAFFTLLILSTHASLAFPDSVFSETDLYDSSNPFLRTIISSGNMRALIVSSGSESRLAGIESPSISIGSFYKNGLLSIMNNPQNLNSDSRVFSEKSGVTLKTTYSGNNLFSIVFNPLPEYLSFFVFRETNDRKTCGVDLALPFSDCASFEFLYQNTWQPASTPEDQWYQDEQSFQGTFLNNFGMKLKSSYNPFSITFCGGCSFSELNLPGYFILLQAAVDTAIVDCSVISSYRSDFYFSPSSGTSRECFTVGAVAEYSPAPWLRIKGNGNYKRSQNDPFNDSRLDDEFDFGATILISLGIKRRIHVWIESSFACEARFESPSTENDYSLDVSLKTNLMSLHQFSFSYAFKRNEGEEEHVLCVKYAIESDSIEYGTRITYSIMSDEQELQLLLGLKSHDIRIKIEANFNFTAFVPDHAQPFSLKIGVDHSL